MNQRFRPALAAAVATLAFIAAPAFAGKTLDAVKQRGSVKSGVTNGVALLPATFNKRGTSNIVAIAERLANTTLLGDGLAGTLRHRSTPEDTASIRSQRI